MHLNYAAVGWVTARWRARNANKNIEKRKKKSPANRQKATKKKKKKKKKKKEEKEMVIERWKK